MAKTLIVVAGPTAIGKTALAIQLAQYYNTEIISADSRQFYKEMEIGTAKPSRDELEAVRHHFINSHSVTDYFNAGDYEKEASRLIENLFHSHDQLILAGGSGLFINAVIHGFDELPAADPEIRNRLNQLLADKGIGHLREMLKKADPVYFAEADTHNPQRIIRALEVWETSGRPFSEFRKKSRKERPYEIVIIGLNTNRSALYENINTRVDKMMQDGLLDEVQSLIPFRQLNPLDTVGYSELFDYLDGKYSLDEAVEKIRQNTRRFAKRQLTWFRKTEGIRWFEPGDYAGILNMLNLIPDT